MPNSLADLIDRLGGRQRALMLLVGLGAAVAILVIAQWAARPQMVPVFSNLPLDVVGKVTQQLETAGIAYQLDRGGSDVMVASEDVARARVAVAQQGMPNAGRPGLELFDQPSWGMTDFTQRVNYRRALEGELERTIGKMRGISGAQVHLALPERASFREPNRQAEASVVLTLHNGSTPAADVVRGIAHLVASSVDGLESTNVTVVDDAGRLLSDSQDPTTPEGMTAHQLKVQREVETYLERKAEDLVERMVGPGNARIQVAAALNFDRIERTVQAVDPEQQALLTEQKSEIVPGAEGGAGQVNTATSYENTRRLETFSAAMGSVRRLTVAIVVNDRELPGADSAQPPVVQARTPEELARIEQLVRNAVGVDSTRGDLVTVASVPFASRVPAAVPDEAAPLDMPQMVQTYGRPGLALLGLLLAFAIALKVIGALKASPPAKAASAGALPAGLPMQLAAAENAPMTLVAPPDPMRSQEMMAKQVQAMADTAVRERALEDVKHNPDMAAKLVRAWLKQA